MRASLVAQLVKNSPSMQETWGGRSPGEGNSYHSSILTWRIPWTEEPGKLQSMGSKRVRTQLSNFHLQLFIGGALYFQTQKACKVLR